MVVPIWQKWKELVTELEIKHWRKKKKIGKEIYFRMKLAQISWEDKVLRVGEGKL